MHNGDEKSDHPFPVLARVKPKDSLQVLPLLDSAGKLLFFKIISRHWRSPVPIPFRSGSGCHRSGGKCLPVLTRSPCMPCWIMRPFSRTRIRSASMMLWMRCAMTKVVRSFIRSRIASRISRFGFGIHRGSGVVQDEDARIFQQGACDGNPLLLAARERSRRAHRPGFYSHQGKKGSHHELRQLWQPVPLLPG